MKKVRKKYWNQIEYVLLPMIILVLQITQKGLK